MVFIALKRLLSRPGLTVLSVAGIAIVISLVVGVPVFSQAVSFRMFREVARFKVLACVEWIVKNSLFWKNDPEIDDYVIEAIRYRTFYGF